MVAPLWCISLRLLVYGMGRFNGANRSAGAAAGAFLRIDLILTVAFGNGGIGAFGFAGTARDTIAADGVNGHFGFPFLQRCLQFA
jgi:hypothetical protein